MGCLRSRSCPSRTLGSTSRSIVHAAESPARSLSANDRIAISPGVWPRSTGSTMSSKLVGLVDRRCIKSSVEHAYDLVAVETPQPDHHELGAARLRGEPWAVVLRG